MNPKLRKIHDRLIDIQAAVQQSILDGSMTKKSLEAAQRKCTKCQERIAAISESGSAASFLIDPCQSYVDALAIIQADNAALAADLLAGQIQEMIAMMLLQICRMQNP